MLSNGTCAGDSVVCSPGFAGEEEPLRACAGGRRGPGRLRRRRAAGRGRTRGRFRRRGRGSQLPGGRRSSPRAPTWCSRYGTPATGRSRTSRSRSTASMSENRDPELADPERPQFVINGVPREIGGFPEAKEASPLGCDTAYVNTWACGPLAEGKQRTFRWSVTAVQAGDFEINWRVAAGSTARQRPLARAAARRRPAASAGPSRTRRPRSAWPTTARRSSRGRARTLRPTVQGTCRSCGSDPRNAAWSRFAPRLSRPRPRARRGSRRVKTSPARDAPSPRIPRPAAEGTSGSACPSSSARTARRCSRACS